MTIESIATDVVAEVQRAQAKFGPFKNGHEGYAVLLEEVDELWQEVKHGTSESALKEARQVAAMAIRFIHDLSDPAKRASHDNVEGGGSVKYCERCGHDRLKGECLCELQGGLSR